MLSYGIVGMMLSREFGISIGCLEVSVIENSLSWES